MSAPYAVISDQHFHDWDAFSSITSEGINSRLENQLKELRRCADTLKAEGGNLIINAGDTFHQRGSLKPSVLNPVVDLHKELIDEGFRIIILSGNHDLEGQDSSRISSSVTTLESVGCQVIHEPKNLQNISLVPWVKNVADLKVQLEEIAIQQKIFGGDVIWEVDLFIHAPVDGVLCGIPDHGITGEYLAGLGFKRVFSGHYHSFLEVYPGVYSIGASTHQTWSDVGSKAGFLLVYNDGVKRYASHAPEFIDIFGDMTEEELMSCDGNYCRVKIGKATPAEIASVKQEIIDRGALGVIVQAIKQDSIEERDSDDTPASSKPTSLEGSMNEYIANKFSESPDLFGICNDILSRVEAVDA